MEMISIQDKMSVFNSKFCNLKLKRTEIYQSLKKVVRLSLHKYGTICCPQDQVDLLKINRNRVSDQFVKRKIPLKGFVTAYLSMVLSASYSSKVAVSLFDSK